MLVYGDPKFSVQLIQLFEACGARIQQANLGSLEDLRALLIFAGQFEQAVADAAVDNLLFDELPLVTTELTDCLARFFVRKFISGERCAEKGAVMELRDRIAQIFASAPSLKKEKVTVKIPEGYAFYALFPEQYCATALTWSRQNSNHRESLVVGLRSIGTSLSAVVKETLCHIGWKSRRITVRPGGHPFHRQLTLSDIHIASDSPVLIVDEGPGISGSSMAAVVRPLISAGFRNIYFFPGHSNEPGIAASAEVREIWRQVPRYTTPLENIRWNSLSLEECLLAETKKLERNKFPPDRIENISGGLWRKFTGNNMEWPVSPPQFERMKLLCQSSKGNSVIWKFAGLHCHGDGSSASQSEVRRLSFVATAGYCPEPLGVFNGFIATPWIDGARLNCSHVNDAVVLRHIGNYIVHAAQPVSFENDIAVQRLADMLYCNAKESLGETAANGASGLVEAALDADVPLAYGDGHLAPHEWVRVNDGRVLKLDAEGHAYDHTLVGEHSWLWDIAGAFIEWNLNMQTAVPLLQAIEEKGMRVDRAGLAFYRAAYAAFRSALMSLGLTQAFDEQEKSRFARAHGYYLRQLTEILKQEGAPLQSAY